MDLEEKRKYHREYMREWIKNPDNYARQRVSHRKKEWKRRHLGECPKRAEVAAYKRKYPEKNRAQVAVHNAIKTGRLVRPDHCENCNASCKPEAHHPDYSKRFDVIFLCVCCHNALRRRERSGI